ncbi:glycosyltransferase family 4 protein [Candidatus Woesearchaeota archaeon]|jgi:L-malate glycosyltransferase|nr:glycosyltransferase family 4 protein [Candidatus Woesearchaeota archaeon]MBT3537577.1 glycosyltransferase family 4 protein [Candidatus Woesearchaeota archaeon]MBT4697413.1 glycosyltransferase family 4 protein [Candidatus Woesearchaeota archaeon]MBT4716441.1 glycosyltransferase family 4 protein [Candidatus Woesearchaeota archaeon]MBT7105246.1 glycosyltransferase family 4 protein [Candidatus Woesearchaeota archaeon]
MRIALINDMIYPYTKGGIEVRNKQIAERLAKLGHEIHIFGARLWDGDDFVRNAVNYHGVHYYKRVYDASGKRDALNPFIFAKKLPKALSKYEFDVIDCSSSTYFPAISCERYCNRNNIPLVVSWNEVFGDYWDEYATNPMSARVGKRYEKKVMNLNANVLAVSKFLKNRLVQFGVDGKKVTVISNGVDLKAIGQAKAGKKKFDLMFAGRLQKLKNVDMFVEVVRILKKGHPKISAIICGEGPERDRLNQLVLKHNLVKNITFTGAVEQSKVYSYMKSSKMLIMPSETEGFGIVAIEAAAARLPVITINTLRNAVVDVVKDKKTGFVVAKDVLLLAKVSEILLKNSKLRKKMGAEAYKLVKENYTWDNVVKKIEKYYKKVSS